MDIQLTALHTSWIEPYLVKEKTQAPVVCL